MSESPNISTFHMSVPRTARIATAGSLSSNTKYIWIACHGYGEIASEFISSMTSIVNEDTYVVAPEALSRFYWGGSFDGKPVASWMTREDRINEIADYTNYLSLLQSELQKQVPQDVKFILFGFSQGCATIMRWAQAKHPICSAIVMWSGILPEDIAYDASYFDKVKMYSQAGTLDRFITPERISQHEALIKEKGLKIDSGTFEGKHKVYGEPLADLRDQIYSAI